MTFDNYKNQLNKKNNDIPVLNFSSFKADLKNSETFKKSKILKSIETITIDLNKDNKSSNYINRPTIHFDHKAELRFDINYILDNSPTNLRKNSLVTLEQLRQAKQMNKLNPEKNAILGIRESKEKKLDDDSFYEFKYKGIKSVKTKKIITQANDINSAQSFKIRHKVAYK